VGGAGDHPGVAVDCLDVAEATCTVAFKYGPIVLAGKLGTQDMTPGSDTIINERNYGRPLNDTATIGKSKNRRRRENQQPCYGLPE